MARLPLALFSAAAICALFGMIWGALMGSTHDFTLAPSLAMMLSGDTGAETAAVIGSILAILGMLTFPVSILVTWRATLA